MLIEFTSKYKALIGCEKHSRRINSQQEEAENARTFTIREISTKERNLNDIKMPRRGQRRRKTFETILNKSTEKFKSSTCWLVLLLLQLSLVEATKRSATINSDLGKFMALLNNFSIKFLNIRSKERIWNLTRIYCCSKVAIEKTSSLTTLNRLNAPTQQQLGQSTNGNKQSGQFCQANTVGQIADLNTKKVFCFYDIQDDFRPQDLNPCLCTHVVYSFVAVRKNLSFIAGRKGKLLLMSMWWERRC